MSDTLTRTTRLRPPRVPAPRAAVEEHTETARQHLRLAQAGSVVAVHDCLVDLVVALTDITRLQDQVVRAQAARADAQRLAGDLLAAVRATLATGQNTALEMVFDKYGLDRPEPAEPSLAGTLAALAQPALDLPVTR